MKKILFILVIALSIISSCSDIEKLDSLKELHIAFIHPESTKNSGNSFEENDRIGFYMHQSSKALQISGNEINNALISFDGSKWICDNTLYWPNNTTAYNFIAYYPYSDISSITNGSFSVNPDQSEGCGNSDFLWANVANKVYSSDPVFFNMSHRLSKIIITIVKGESYTEDLPASDNIVVKVLNTGINGSVDYSTGTITKNYYPITEDIICHPLGEYKFEAVIIPQSINSTKTPLFEVIINDVSYLFSGSISYRNGKQQLITLPLESSPENVKIGIFIDGEIQDWV